MQTWRYADGLQSQIILFGRGRGFGALPHAPSPEPCYCRWQYAWLFFGGGSKELKNAAYRKAIAALSEPYLQWYKDVQTARLYIANRRAASCRDAQSGRLKASIKKKSNYFADSMALAISFLRFSSAIALSSAVRSAFAP